MTEYEDNMYKCSIHQQLNDSRFFLQRRFAIENFLECDQMILKYIPYVELDYDEYCASVITVKEKYSHVIIPSMLNNKKIVAATGLYVDEINNQISYYLEELIVEEGIKFLQIDCENCTQLKRINLPCSIIGLDCNFKNCKNLEEADIPDNIKYLGWYIFENCEKLESIQLPISLKVIDCDAFCHSGLKTIVIPSGTKIIYDSAFRECRNLKTVVLPKSLNFIADDAFDDCHPEIKFFVPPDSYAWLWVLEHGFKYEFIRAPI